MESLNNILNYLEISPLLGTAGQPTPEQFEPIAQAGYQVVINLAMPDSDGALPDEAERVAALGMKYIAIPVVWTAPTRANLTDFFAALDDHSDQTVFVHCAKNMRVSAFVYLYRRIRLNEAEDICIEDLYSIWEPEGMWAEFIEQALRNPL